MGLTKSSLIRINTTQSKYQYNRVAYLIDGKPFTFYMDRANNFYNREVEFAYNKRKLAAIHEYGKSGKF